MSVQTSNSNDPNNPSVGQTVYTGAAEFGKFYAIFTAVVATLVGILFITWGIYILDSAGKPVHPNPPKGTPANTQPPNTVNPSSGWILIVVGILSIFFAWLWVYLTTRYQFLAAATGVYGAVRII